MFAIALSGCYQELEVREVAGLTDGNLTLQGFQGVVTVRLYNPNAYSVRALESDVILYVQDRKVGRVELVGPVLLPKHEESTFSLQVESEPGALGDVLKNELMGFILGGKVELRAEGSVRGKAWGIPVTVPVKSVESIGLTK